MHSDLTSTFPKPGQEYESGSDGFFSGFTVQRKGHTATKVNKEKSDESGFDEVLSLDGGTEGKVINYHQGVTNLPMELEMKKKVTKFIFTNAFGSHMAPKGHEKR